MLPPLMFSTEEVESLVLGLSWVAARGDAQLSGALRKALTKIEAVLPTAVFLHLAANF
jgi:predicted DNA-binding transcriptional regulator YafY